MKPNSYIYVKKWKYELQQNAGIIAKPRAMRTRCSDGLRAAVAFRERQIGDLQHDDSQIRGVQCADRGFLARVRFICR
jgi:hypothetical protein